MLILGFKPEYDKTLQLLQPVHDTNMNFAPSKDSVHPGHQSSQIGVGFFALHSMSGH